MTIIFEDKIFYSRSWGEDNRPTLETSFLDPTKLIFQADLSISKVIHFQHKDYSF